MPTYIASHATYIGFRLYACGPPTTSRLGFAASISPTAVSTLQARRHRPATPNPLLGSTIQCERASLESPTQSRCPGRERPTAAPGQERSATATCLLNAVGDTQSENGIGLRDLDLRPLASRPPEFSETLPAARGKVRRSCSSDVPTQLSRVCQADTELMIRFPDQGKLLRFNDFANSLLGCRQTTTPSGTKCCPATSRAWTCPGWPFIKVTS